MNKRKKEKKKKEELERQKRWKEIQADPKAYFKKQNEIIADNSDDDD